jgi:cell division protein FtsB
VAQTSFKKRVKKIAKTPRLLLVTGILVVLGASLLLSNKGLWRHVTLLHEISVRQDNLADLLTAEKDLQKHVDLLRAEDPTTVERVARERYSMKKSGEIIFRQVQPSSRP